MNKKPFSSASATGSALRSALEDLLASERHLWGLRLQEVRTWQEIVPQNEALRISASAELVEKVLEERSRNLLDSLAEAGSVGHERERVSAELEERKTGLRAARERFEAAERKVKHLLVNDRRIVALSEQEESLKKLVAENSRSDAEIEADVRERLDQFTADPIFSYLLKRGFGTESYTAGRITRALDQVVARLSKFEREFSVYEAVRLYPEEHARMIAEAGKALRVIEPQRKSLRDHIKNSLDVHREHLADALNAVAALEDLLSGLEKKATQAMARVRQGVCGNDRETRMMTDAVVTMLSTARDAASAANPHDLAGAAQRSESLIRARLSVARDADRLRARVLSLLDEVGDELVDGRPQAALAS